MRDSLLGGRGLLCVVIWVVAGCSPSERDSAPNEAAPPLTHSSAGSEPLLTPARHIADDPNSLEQSRTTLRFVQMNDAVGIHHAYRADSEPRKRRILESIGGGGGTFDYDADGRLDLALCGGGYFSADRTVRGYPTALFRNEGDWKFADVSQPAGGLSSPRYTHGTHAADYDNDGFVDFVVCGYGGLQLWHNLGDGTLEEIQDAAQLRDSLWSSCAGWGDLNRDGCLDLFVVHYLDWSLDNDPVCLSSVPGERETCAPRDFASLPDTLYFSNGDGTFRDGSNEAGIHGDPQVHEVAGRELGKGLGVLINDFDVDGDQDIYVANDTDNNQLFVNQGDGTFVEDGQLRGVAVDDAGMPNGSMGVDVGDFNRDGLPDLWVTNSQLEVNALYRNEGDGRFMHVSRRMGIGLLRGGYVGFGTVFADLDRDGYEDLVIANGHVQFFPDLSPLKQMPLVFLNAAGRSFRRVRLDADPYFGQGQTGRGLAAGDLDNDGDIDFCFVNNNDTCGLIRNDSSDDGRWLRVRLIGVQSSRDCIGAMVKLHTDQGDLLRLVKGGGSYASQCDLRLLWGIPANAKVTGLTVFWPSMQVRTYEVPSLGIEMTLVEE